MELQSMASCAMQPKRKTNAAITANILMSLKPYLGLDAI
jgi:hypothetical protein